MPNIYFESLDKTFCDNGYKPLPAIRGQAEWWKSMHPYHKDAESSKKILDKATMLNVKSCPGIRDSINFGYILFSQFDVYLDGTQDGIIHWTAPMREIPPMYVENNDAWMMDQYKIPKEYNSGGIKINPLWAVKTDPGYSLWITHPMHRFDLPFRAFDAIIDSDVFPSYFPYSFMVRKDFKGIIKAGTPLVQVIPFKREEWSSHFVEADKEDIKEKQRSVSAHFTGGYKKIFWKRKKFG